MAIKINRFSFSVSGKNPASSGAKANAPSRKGQEPKKTLAPKDDLTHGPAEKIKEQRKVETESRGVKTGKKNSVTFSASNAFSSRRSAALTSDGSVENFRDEESERSYNLVEDTCRDEEPPRTPHQEKILEENEDITPKNAPSGGVSFTGKGSGLRFSLSGARKMFGQGNNSGRKKPLPNREREIERHENDAANKKKDRGAPITDRRPTINFMKKPNVVIRPYCSYGSIDGKYPSDAKQVQSNIRFTVHDRNLAIRSGLKWE